MALSVACHIYYFLSINCDYSEPNFENLKRIVSVRSEVSILCDGKEECLLILLKTKFQICTIDIKMLKVIYER